MKDRKGNRIRKGDRVMVIEGLCPIPWTGIAGRTERVHWVGDGHSSQNIWISNQDKKGGNGTRALLKSEHLEVLHG